MEKMEQDSRSYPPIPLKRYFTIGEVSELCGVKPHIIRYWEQEFVQLRSIRRRGNRRYYQHHEVLLIRRIHELLYRQGFSISGARTRLSSSSDLESDLIEDPNQVMTTYSNQELLYIRKEIKEVITLLLS